MKKGMVVYAFPASGKTTVSEKYDNFIDLESGNFQYDLTPEQLKLSVEERKGLKRTQNPNWPGNYFEAIKLARYEYDYIFVAYAGLEYCKKENIPYMSFFPTLDQKEDYIARMRNRGNGEAFVQKIANNFENYINSSKEDTQAIKIEMQKGEYLEDCLKRINIIKTDKESLL